MNSNADWWNALQARFGPLDRDELVRCWVSYAVGLDDRDECLGRSALECATDRLDVILKSDADLLFDGELRLIGQKKTVFLRRGIDSSRRSFTIAHELGHAALFDLAPALRQDGPDVERLCNLFAAELLLPASAVRKEVAGGSYARALGRLWGKSEASLTSTFIQFAECIGGTAGIATAEGKIVRSYGRVAEPNEIETHLSRIASSKERSFLARQVSPAWILETGFIDARYVFVLRRTAGFGPSRAGRTQLAG